MIYINRLFMAIFVWGSVAIVPAKALEDARPFRKSYGDVCQINNSLDLNSRDFVLADEAEEKLQKLVKKYNFVEKCGDFLGSAINSSVFLALPFILGFNLGGFVGGCAMAGLNAFMFGQLFVALRESDRTVSKIIAKYARDKYEKIFRDLYANAQKHSFYIAEPKSQRFHSPEELLHSKRLMLRELALSNSLIENKFQFLVKEDLADLKGKKGEVVVLQRFEFAVRSYNPNEVVLDSSDQFQFLVGRIKKVQGDKIVLENIDNSALEYTVKIDDDHVNLLYKPLKNSFYLKNLRKIPSLEGLSGQTATMVLTNKFAQIENQLIHIHSYEDHVLTYQRVNSQKIETINIEESRVEFEEDGLNLDRYSDEGLKEFNGFLGLHLERPDDKSLDRIINELDKIDDESYLTSEEIREIKEGLAEMDQLVLEDIKNSDMPVDEKNNLLEEIEESRKVAKEIRLLELEE
ncbi:MAG: hypothetical protein H6621_09970 [Halobacteriovoraceae bacterium]|nr:hypothetical protein [Halobacteriovoraceae bacterium]MCB9095383.1 hypothetical protein [Halobacteriovoraceae bacterium]